MKSRSLAVQAAFLAPLSVLIFSTSSVEGLQFRHRLQMFYALGLSGFNAPGNLKRTVPSQQYFHRDLDRFATNYAPAKGVIHFNRPTAVQDKHSQEKRVRSSSSFGVLAKARAADQANTQPEASPASAEFWTANAVKTHTERQAVAEMRAGAGASLRNAENHIARVAREATVVEKPAVAPKLTLAELVEAAATKQATLAHEYRAAAKEKLNAATNTVDAVRTELKAEAVRVGDKPTTVLEVKDLGALTPQEFEGATSRTASIYSGLSGSSSTSEEDASSVASEDYGEAGQILFMGDAYVDAENFSRYWRQQWGDEGRGHKVPDGFVDDFDKAMRQWREYMGYYKRNVNDYKDNQMEFTVDQNALDLRAARLQRARTAKQHRAHEAKPAEIFDF